MDNFLYLLAVNAVPFLTAITLHEAAHGYAALKFGDGTAKMLGRLSLNPLRHVDPLGTIALPALTLLVGGFFFGWAKAVPVNSNNLHKPKTDMIWVAAAGPAANLLMMIAWAFLLKFSPDSAVSAIAKAGIAWNLSLMVLNLLPLLPLDGGRIVAGLLPNKLANAYSKLEPYGMFILIALMLTKTLNIILGPLYEIAAAIVHGILQ
ncbi:MAG: hypothetical protein RLZZ502_1740 [Pseudomonadota bacterium]|jgi:Zn-dependent protease